MPDIDRTQVVIETEIDDRKAAKKIDDLEKKLDKLEEPRTIDLKADYDRVFSKLQQELASVNQRISDMFKKSWYFSRPTIFYIGRSWLQIRL